MGKRARAAGVTNALLRAARAAEMVRDDEAAAVAQRVYHAAVELKGDGVPDPLPMPVMAPLVVAAETIAPGACKLAGLPVTEEMSREVAAYLVTGFREMAVMLDPQHFAEWRQRADDAASRPEPG